MICNCCTYEGPFAGFGRRPRVQCPRCASLERHRVMAALLDRRPHWYRGLKVLHVAAEDCLAGCFAGAAEYSAPISCELCSLAIDAEAFDLIVHNHVMEHVRADRIAFREQLRVLKPGGYLLFTVPTRGPYTSEGTGRELEEERLERWGHRGHWRRYGHDNLVERLHGCGFRDAGFDRVTDWKPAPRASKLDDGLIFWARKTATAQREPSP